MYMYIYIYIHTCTHTYISARTIAASVLSLFWSMVILCCFMLAPANNNQNTNDDMYYNYMNKAKLNNDDKHRNPKPKP